MSRNLKLGVLFSFPEGQLDFRLAILRSAEHDFDFFGVGKAGADMDHQLSEILESASKAVTPTFGTASRFRRGDR